MHTSTRALRSGRKREAQRGKIKSCSKMDEYGEKTHSFGRNPERFSPLDVPWSPGFSARKDSFQVEVCPNTTLWVPQPFLSKRLIFGAILRRPQRIFVDTTFACLFADRLCYRRLFICILHLVNTTRESFSRLRTKRYRFTFVPVVWPILGPVC